MSIRKLRPSDRGEIERIVRETGVFSEQEVAIALELLDIAITNPAQRDYEIHVAEDDCGVLGYICFGPVPLTQGVYDLYWIAVSPGAQGKGVGKQLVAFMEDALEARRARKVMIETSSTPVYDPTRAFYLRLGYHEAARIADFYKPGDAKVIYARDLG
ncbi:MAG: GNAT family N-acetyltransferase [Acidobacteria bacterium]|nr:GNAT family N-acetyltransferase [Acidobacteriota bacterium]